MSIFSTNKNKQCACIGKKKKKIRLYNEKPVIRLSMTKSNLAGDIYEPVPTYERYTL